MIATTVNILIGSAKLEEAVKFITAKCVGPLSIFQTQAVLFQSTYSEYYRDKLMDIDRTSELNILKLRLIEFAQDLDGYQKDFEPDNLQEVLTSTLLLNDSFPFVDRLKFRNKFEQALQSNQATVIFVEGESRSGMSYIEKYLSNVTNKLELLLFVPLEIPAVLGVPDIILGEKLAKSILNNLGIPIDFDDKENEQFKFVQFINTLKRHIKEKNRLPVFFLHDFHKIEDANNNLLEFIFTLLNSLKNDFPKCLFIIAGFNYTNIRHWHNDLRFTTQVYKIESISIEDVKTCLSAIFQKYEQAIKKIFQVEKIDENDYIQGILPKLVDDENNIDIPRLGLRISEHLLALKE